MQTTQCLVAIGGKATRMRRGGISVPLSKSFLPLCGKPLLYWNLICLYAAGIRRLILCGDDSLQLREAELLLDDLGIAFHSVQLIQDPGLGVHGLPFQVMHRNPRLLDETFIFECGHSLMKPIHYFRIAQLKVQGAIVFSAFKPHPSNIRQPVLLSRGHAVLLKADQPGSRALAHPMVIDRSYVRRLPLLGFNVEEIIACYASEQRLQYVFSEMPPEFDIIEEMQAAYSQYGSYLIKEGLVQSRSEPVPFWSKPIRNVWYPQLPRSAALKDRA